MATATITLKKGTTAEWTESKRVLDDGELGLETTTSGHRIIRIGNGSTEFMSLPVTWLVRVISFEAFSMMVDEALERMKKMLENNKAMQTLVSGEAGETVEKDM